MQEQIQFNILTISLKNKKEQVISSHLTRCVHFFQKCSWFRRTGVQQKLNHCCLDSLGPCVHLVTSLYRSSSVCWELLIPSHLLLPLLLINLPTSECLLWVQRLMLQVFSFPFLSIGPSLTPSLFISLVLSPSPVQTAAYTASHKHCFSPSWTLGPTQCNMSKRYSHVIKRGRAIWENELMGAWVGWTFAWSTKKVLTLPNQDVLQRNSISK